MASRSSNILLSAKFIYNSHDLLWVCRTLILKYCTSLCSLLLDIHNSIFTSTSEACSLLDSTVFQSSMLLECHPDSWGSFWGLISWSRQLFGFFEARCIDRTKFWVLGIDLISSGRIWGKFYDFVRFKRPKFWLFTSGLPTYYRGSCHRFEVKASHSLRFADSWILLELNRNRFSESHLACARKYA